MMSLGQPTVEWETTYGGAYSDRANYVQQTNDGGYIIAGFTYDSLANSDAYVIKTDASGIEEWSQTYGDIYNDFAHYVQ